MPTGKYYFHIKPEVITDYLNFTENILDTDNFCVILLGDFNDPGVTVRAGHLCLTATDITNSRTKLYSPGGGQAYDRSSD
jgi:hypothetical protein